VWNDEFDRIWIRWMHPPESSSITLKVAECSSEMSQYTV